MFTEFTSSFSLHAMQLPWSPDWAQLFGRDAPLVLEIGFGNGKFLADLAEQHPDLNCIGIERAHGPLQWTEKLVQKKGLSNVRLIYSEAMMALTCLFEPASLPTVHINFSDPWPKKRHHERRLINPAFLNLLTTRLAPHGLLYIATDIEQYAGEIGVALSQTAGLKNAYASPWMTQRENPRIVTHYEQKAQREGRTCHYFKWQRSSAVLPTMPVYKEDTMPNVRLKLPLAVENIIAAFEPQTLRYQDRIVKLMRIYHEPGQAVLLFEVLIEEPLFSQHLMLKLVGRSTAGEFVIQPAPIGYPRATRGVQDAVYYVMQWLVGLGGTVLEQAVKAPEIK